jgi:FkbM family methyltransferase
VDGKTEVLFSKVAELSKASGQMATELTMVTARTMQMEALLRTGLVKHCPSFSVESSLPESEEELVRLAESLAVLRPLVPYPEWRFDADWYNPDLSFQLRQRIWQHFADRRCDAPVMTPWHLGTRLCLHMNNDLSRQIFIAGCVEPNEFAFVDRFLEPGMTFVDVGANEGIYSIFAAQRVGPTGTVWAFEPSERELASLRRNSEHNGLVFRIFPIGLSDSERVADLYIAEDSHAGLNTLGKIAYEGVNIARTETVQLFRLDDVVAKNPLSRIDIIKIDVEGTELYALRGAVETLRRYRPLLLFEVERPHLAAQGSTPEELVAFVCEQGYTLYQFDPATGLPTPAKPLEYSMNMIAVPEERSLPAAVFSYLPVERRRTNEGAT